MGGHGVVQCEFYGGATESRCIKGHHFLLMLVQLLGFAQSPPFGLSVV